MSLAYGQALLGFLVGLVIVALVTFLLWQARAIPGVIPRPLDLSVKSMPEKALGYDRDDLDLLKLPTAEARAAAISRIEADTVGLQESFRYAYGGSGIRVGYGEYTTNSIRTFTVVNGDINPTLAVTSNFVERVGGVPGGSPLAVRGTSTTTCVFFAASLTPLNGKSGEQVITELLRSTSSSGLYECVRRSVDRNLSVQLQVAVPQPTQGERTPEDLARDFAAETDRVWELLD